MNLIQTIMHLSDSVLLPTALWAVMFAMGTGLTPRDFLRAVSGRRAFLLGAGSMLFLVPAAGSLLAVLFGPTPALVVGLILLATTPSGILSNLLTDIAGGDVALSVSISLTLSLIYVFTLPFIAHLALVHAFGAAAPIQIPLWDSLSHILMVTLIPIACGMVFRRLAAGWAARLAPPLKTVATVVLCIVFAMITVQQFGVLKASFGALMAIVVAMNLSSIIIALVVSKLGRLTRKETIAVSVEHMIRQEGTAIFVAVTLLHREDMSMPMIINTFLGMACCLTFVSIVTRRRASAQVLTESVINT
jgi:BASS family bile acid:Na+ symporter